MFGIINLTQAEAMEMRDYDYAVYERLDMQNWSY